MQLLEPDTIWAFVSGSDEERFLCDIIFGVNCLLHRGFPLNNILLFIDQPIGSGFASIYKFPEDLAFFSTNEIKQQLINKKPKKLIVFVTGHGTEEGISTSLNIKPYHLLSTLKGLGDLDYALIILGQCFAGTFNFLEARSVDPVSKKVISPEICIIGATDLTFSLSVYVDISKIDIINDFDCSHNWQANIFLFHFMYFVALPIDIDGDGHISVLDIYKLTGINTTKHLAIVKQNEIRNIFQNLLNLTEMRSQTEASLLSKQFEEKAHQDLFASSSMILVSQDCWILNANLARQLKL